MRIEQRDGTGRPVSVHHVDPLEIGRVSVTPEWIGGERACGRKSMRIAWVTPCVMLGGVETVLRGLLQELPREWEMDLLTWMADGDAVAGLRPLVDRLWVSGVSERFPGGYEGNEQFADLLAGVLNGQGYDLVIGTNTALTYSVARSVSRAVCVEYLHGGLGWHSVSKPCVDHVLAVSQWCLDSAEAARGALGGHVVYNGVRAGEWEQSVSRADSRQRLGLPESGSLVMYVGRVSEEKGVDVAVRACEGQDWTLVLVGKGYHQEYAHRVAEMMSANCIWLQDGLRAEDVKFAYWAADAVVCPSRHEAFGLAGVEALAAGKPVVASRVGGLPEALGEWARYADADDVDGLRVAVGKALCEGFCAGEAHRWVASERSLRQQALTVKALLEEWVLTA